MKLEKPHTIVSIIKLSDFLMLEKGRMKKRLLSLFSGCGGMDLGFEGGFEVFEESINENIHNNWITQKKGQKVLLSSTCFEIVFANDILPFAKTVWNTNFNFNKKLSSLFHLESVVDLVKKHHANEYKFPKNIDVVTGGFPCQDFSLSGKRKGFNSHKSHLGKIEESVGNPENENRGLLYTWMKEVVSIVKPKVFIAENVKGLVSLGNVKEIIEKDFGKIDGDGYFVMPARVLHSAEYGVPQSRERVFFIGLNRRYLKKTAINEFSKTPVPSDYDPYPYPTHIRKRPNTLDYIFKSRLKPFVTINTALSGLKEPSEEKDDLSQMHYSGAKYYGKMQGNTEIKLNDIGPTIRSEHHGNIEFRRLAKVNGGIIQAELDKGLIERRLTVRECARIQTFPDSFTFVSNGGTDPNNKVSGSSCYKLIGNAVPPLLAYHFAKRLELIWDNLFVKQKGLIVK